MAKAFQCDRCLTYASGGPVLKVDTINLEQSNSKKEYELCPKCLYDLTDWLNVANTAPEGDYHDTPRDAV